MLASIGDRFGGDTAGHPPFARRVPVADHRHAFSGVDVPCYTAWLLGGRAIYDVTERFDVGVLASMLFSSEGRSRQSAYGIEVGAVVQTNLRLSLGFNLTGFRDRDLTGSEYTAQGFFLRLRYKFDTS